MRRCVFLDRDGTLVHDAGYTWRLEDYRLLPGAVAGLQRLSAAGFGLVVATNQSGIGRGLFGEADYRRFQDHLEADLRARGVVLEASYHCPHRPDAGCACRKPAPGLLERAARERDLDLAASWIIGDSARDTALATRAGLRGAVLVRTGHGAAEEGSVPPGIPRADDLRAAAEHILTAGA